VSRSFLNWLAGPEAVAAALFAGIWLVCARHASYGARDVALLEKLVWLLPAVAVAGAFVPLAWTQPRPWWWLARANAACFALLVFGAYRIVGGFGAPGSGPKGQDAGLILALSLGVVLAAPANTISAAVLLAEHRPGFAEWFRLRPVLGSGLTLLAAVPVGVGLAFGVGGLAAGLLGVASAFKR
jgi:hypothetical protein